MLPAVASTMPDMVAGAPLDYSFKELKTVLEMETEEPRSGGKRRPQVDKDATAAAQAALDGSAADLAAGTGASGGATASAHPGPGDAAKGGAASGAPNVSGLGTSTKSGAGATTLARPMPSMIKRRIRQVTVAVKLNNNMIDSVTDLPQALEFVMDDPLRNLQWIDLSFNQLQSIQAELLDFKQMKALYLHGNHIKSLPSVERLKKLPKLISLTLNGNPIEGLPFYRRYVVGALPDLRTLDHSTITDDEVHGAHDWFQAHASRSKVRKERLEEELMANNE